MNTDIDPEERAIFQSELQGIQGKVAVILCRHFGEAFCDLEWHLDYVFGSNRPWVFACGPARGQLYIGARSKEFLLERLDHWSSIGKIRLRCFCQEDVA